MMIKMIVSDLDGTLLDHTRRISERDHSSIKTAFNEGFEICIASGRMYSEINIIMQSFKNGYHAIGQNGATVYKKNRKQLASSVFEPEVSAELLQTTNRYKHFVNFIHCTDDSFYLKERTEESISYESRILTDCTIRSDLEAALIKDEIRSCKFSYFGELEKLIQLKAELNTQFEGKIETFISDKDCLDVMPLDVSKGVGLSLLIKELGIEPNEVACIGDSFNDLSMFAITKHSFAMSNSHKDIRNQANTVIKSVADAIDHIISYNRTFISG